MQPWMIAVLVTTVVVVAFVAWLVYDRNRSKRLRDRFGPEYDRAVSEIGNRRRAESELVRREALANRIHGRRLNPLDREKYLSQWKLCQAQFVDDPAGAVVRADALVGEIMQTRGATNERMTDIVAAYPQHANRYREACQIVARHSRREASTEELRTAFLHYRTLFDDLLGGYDEKLERAS